MRNQRTELWRGALCLTIGAGWGTCWALASGEAPDPVVKEMSKPRAPVSGEGIARVVERLAERFRPRKVILFGSRARGAAREDSDVDLLVVMAQPPGRLAAWKAIGEIRRQAQAPLQVVFMSPRDFEETKDVGGGMAYPAHHEGKVVYEADM